MKHILHNFRSSILPLSALVPNLLIDPILMFTTLIFVRVLTHCNLHKLIIIGLCYTIEKEGNRKKGKKRREKIYWRLAFCVCFFYSSVKSSCWIIHLLRSCAIFLFKHFKNQFICMYIQISVWVNFHWIETSSKLHLYFLPN